MIRYIVLSILLLLLISCNWIKIIRANEVRISEKPLRIDTSFYSAIKDSFGLDKIDTVDINYGSLIPKFKMALGIKHFRRDSILFNNGCMFPSGVNLIIQDSSGFHMIWNKEGLKRYFSPIETKEEALSYIHAASGLSPSYDFKIKSSYRYFTHTLRTTYSIELNNGFEVNLFDYEVCGCGPHTHLMIKYMVSFEGEIQELERIDLYEDPTEDRVCID